MELDQITEELQASIKAFGEVNIKLSNAHNREFALKIENEKLGARVSELYKVNAQLEAENKKLKGESL